MQKNTVYKTTNSRSQERRSLTKFISKYIIIADTRESFILSSIPFAEHSATAKIRDNSWHNTYWFNQSLETRRYSTYHSKTRQSLSHSIWDITYTLFKFYLSASNGQVLMMFIGIHLKLTVKVVRYILPKTEITNTIRCSLQTKWSCHFTRSGSAAVGRSKPEQHTEYASQYIINHFSHSLLKGIIDWQQGL